MIKMTKNGSLSLEVEDGPLSPLLPFLASSSDEVLECPQIAPKRHMVMPYEKPNNVYLGFREL